MADPVIDISHWQETVNFDTMSDAGVVGVIHKATEGASNIDDRYAERKAQAEEAGILFGAYHFLRPGDMVQQAGHFVNVAGDDLDIYAADHEDTGVSLSKLKQFLKEVERLTGKKAVIYSGHVIKEQVGSSTDAELAQHRLWIAHYTTASSPTWPTQIWPNWWLWQYTDQGSVPGVSGKADCNRYDGTEEELFEDWTGGEATPEPGPEPEPPVEMAEVTITITVTAKGANIKVIS